MESINWESWAVLITAGSSIFLGVWSNRIASKGLKHSKDQKKKENQNELALKIVERMVSVFSSIRRMRSPEYKEGPFFYRITRENYPMKSFVEDYHDDFENLKTQQLSLEVDSLRASVLLGKSVHDSIDSFQFFLESFVWKVVGFNSEYDSSKYYEYKLEEFKDFFNSDPNSEFNQELMKLIKSVFTELSPFLDEKLENFQHFRGYGINTPNQ